MFFCKIIIIGRSRGRRTNGTDSTSAPGRTSAEKIERIGHQPRAITEQVHGEKRNVGTIAGGLFLGGAALMFCHTPTLIMPPYTPFKLLFITGVGISLLVSFLSKDRS